MICENTVKKFCCENISKIENYDKAIADTTQTWDCHHRLELRCPVYKSSSTTLKDWGLYYNRPASELIFLRHDEHSRLHSKETIVGKTNFTYEGRKHTEKVKRLISEANKGKSISEEHKRRISETHKGKKLSEETKRKISETKRGKHYRVRDYQSIYVLDNRRTEPLYFNTLAEVCEFLGYKNIRGFKMGNAYHGYIITKSSKINSTN